MCSSGRTATLTGMTNDIKHIDPTAPVGSGIDTSRRLVLLGMRLTVGAALIIGLPGRRNYR
jgi:hypothetical protein